MFRKSNKDKKLLLVFGKHCMGFPLWLLPFASVSPSNGAMQLECHLQEAVRSKRESSHCPTTYWEGQMPLAEIGCIFDASIIHCRIDFCFTY